MKIILQDFIDFIIPLVLVRYVATKWQALIWFNSTIQKFQLKFRVVLQFITHSSKQSFSSQNALN